MRSLNSCERFEELTQELEGCRWDAILLISGTWRVSNAEIWETQQGHIFMGSGKFENKRGVGILVKQEVAKTYQLDGLHQRTRHINVEHSQETTCSVDECSLPPFGICGPPRCTDAQNNRDMHEFQKRTYKLWEETSMPN